MTMDLEFAARIFGRLVDGLWMTIFIVIASMILGNLLAIPVALARVSERWWLRYPAAAYILFIRGTPLIVQMFMIYYGLGQFPAVRQSFLWPLLRDALVCAVLALSLNTAGYSGEVLRGAITAVPKGLKEAGTALGMTRAKVMFLITLPLAFRQSLPTFANESVLLLKASAIVFTITIRDIMGEAVIIRSQTFRTLEPLISAALLYLVLTFLIVQGFSLLERRLNVHRRKASVTELLAGMR